MHQSNAECIPTHLIKEFEGPVVNVDLIEGEVLLQTLQEVRHASLDFHALHTLIFDLPYFNMDPRRGTSYFFEVEKLNRSIIGLALDHAWHTSEQLTVYVYN